MIIKIKDSKELTDIIANAGWKIEIRQEPYSNGTRTAYCKPNSKLSYIPSLNSLGLGFTKDGFHHRTLMRGLCTSIKIEYDDQLNMLIISNDIGIKL
jgi:hypothetical protein